MRRSVLVLCVFGVILLIVGSVIAVPSVRSMVYSATIYITSSGQVVYPDGSSEHVSQQVSGATSLDLLGYVVIFISLWFFAVAFVWNRKLA